VQTAATQPSTVFDQEEMPAQLVVRGWQQTVYDSRIYSNDTSGKELGKGKGIVLTDSCVSVTIVIQRQERRERRYTNGFKDLTQSNKRR
jgi:hypothetical protein